LRRYTTLLTVAGVCILAVVGCQKRSADEAPEPKHPTSLDELPEDVNAVQNEMQLLNTAMQNTLTLIANDALEGIPAQIKKVHPARQLTAKALEQGRYEPPVNADNMERFKELDAQFHRDLKGLLKASKEDDLQGATEQYGKLVNGCTNCHTQFRFK